jgi:hypothetical protein
LREVRVLGARNITDAGLKALAGIPALADVSLDRAEGITDDGVEFLVRERPNLASFCCWAIPITARGLFAFSGLPRLRYLELGGGATDEEARAIEEAADPFRRQNPDVYLSIVAQRRQPAAPAGIGAAPVLARLAGVGPARTLRVPSGSSQAEWEQALDGRSDWLAVRCESRAMTDAWVTSLAEFPDLVAFSNQNISPAGLTSSGMARFAVFPKLKVFHICSANTLADLDFARVIEHCPDLEDVWVCDSGASQIGPASMAALAKSAQLRRLHLRGLARGTTDTFLEAFAEQLPRLELVVIDDGAELTPERVGAFRRARPGVRLQVPVAEAPFVLTPEPLDEEVF